MFSKKTLRVLVAEDSHLNMLVIQKFLAQDFFELSLTEDGGQAISIFKSMVEKDMAPDIVLLDFEMPVNSGDEVAQEIRAFEKEHNLKRTPIVAVTALNDESTIEKCAQSGMDYHLVKPMTREQLLSAMLYAALTTKEGN